MRLVRTIKSKLIAKINSAFDLIMSHTFTTLVSVPTLIFVTIFVVTFTFVFL